MKKQKLHWRVGQTSANIYYMVDWLSITSKFMINNKGKGQYITVLSSTSKGPFCLDMMFISGIYTKVVM